MSDNEIKSGSVEDRQDWGLQCRLNAPLSKFLDDKTKNTDVDDEGDHTCSGSYVQDLERVILEWINWMTDHCYETFPNLDGQHIGEGARSELAARAKSGEISNRTAWKYYRLVSFYLSHCYGWEYTAGNLAETKITEDPMPSREYRDSSEQQFWSPGLGRH